MCGISGLSHKDPLKPVDTELLRKMTDIVSHRGPDGEGFFNGPGTGLGFCRLSIIDLESGDQPISNETGALQLICNGEIYNFKALRSTLIHNGHVFKTKSDAEVIVHLYEDHGTKCLDFLRGMFAFALWDSDRQQLLLARDRLGIKPLHYTVARDRTLYFGSEIKSLLVAHQVSKDVNAKGLADLFTFGFILSPDTLFHAIHILPAGHYMTYRHGDICIKQYWDLRFPPKCGRPACPEKIWAIKLREKLEEVVGMHMQSDVPVSAWLSAGIDSSAVTALMKKFSHHPVNTFSLTFVDHPAFDEVAGQKTLDQFDGYDLSNQRVPVRQGDVDLFLKGIWHHESPTSSANHATRMLLSNASGRDYKVVLTGEGADEIFGGYPWYRFNNLFRPLAVLPDSFRRLPLELSGVLTRNPWASSVFLAPRLMDLNRYANLLGAFGFSDPMGRLLSDDWQQAIAESPNENHHLINGGMFRQWHDFEKLQYMEIKTRLADYIVQGLDRSSMAYSVEARVPFLDHELVELAAQIPPSMKLKYGKEKYIFRKAMASCLPKEIIRRKKRGLLAPGSMWLRGNIPEFIKYFFSESQLRKKGYFRPAFVNRLLVLHRSGKANFSRALMAVLNTQIWDELFIRGFRQ